MIITVVGPIDFWWHENWESPKHLAYMDWRNHISKALVEAGHLVYHPHNAFKGAWDERAQIVNDVAIVHSDLLINLRPEGVPAYGTEAEVKMAEEYGIPVLAAPPGNYLNIENLIKPLDDPYDDVQRKSYTKC